MVLRQSGYQQIVTVLLASILTSCGGNGAPAAAPAFSPPPPAAFVPQTTFSEISVASGWNHSFRDVVIDRNGMGAAAGDYDNDGDLDIFHVTGWEQLDPRDVGSGDDGRSHCFLAGWHADSAERCRCRSVVGCPAAMIWCSAEFRQHYGPSFQRVSFRP